MTGSDASGLATLYVYPGVKQYLGAADWDKKWQLQQHKEVTLNAGDVLDDVVMVVLPTGK